MFLPVKYIAVGRKGRDLLIRRGKKVIADFSNLPAAPSFADVSAIGRLAVEEFKTGEVDEVYLVYTSFVNMGRQVATVKKLLPLELEGEGRVQDFEHQSNGPAAAYEYEPDMRGFSMRSFRALPLCRSIRQFWNHKPANMRLV